MTPRVREILSWYGADNVGTPGNLARLLDHGRMAGTGKLVILPVDQGFEHGPARSFAPNPPAYDPHYHEPWCDTIQLNLTQGLALHPGAPPQLLHGDQDMWRGAIGETEYVVNVTWPFTRHTRTNGATSSGRAATAAAR